LQISEFQNFIHIANFRTMEVVVKF